MRAFLTSLSYFFETATLNKMLFKTTAVIDTKWPGPTCEEDNPGDLTGV